MADFTIKQNDTAPALRATLKDSDGAVVDLTGASGVFHMSAGGVVKVNAAIVIVDAANGIAEYRWSAGDTDTADVYDGEFQITYSDSTVETFPNNGYWSISIPEELA